MHTYLHARPFGRRGHLCGRWPLLFEADTRRNTVWFRLRAMASWATKTILLCRPDDDRQTVAIGFKKRRRNKQSFGMGKTFFQIYICTIYVGIINALTTGVAALQMLIINTAPILVIIRLYLLAGWPQQKNAADAERSISRDPPLQMSGGEL